MGKVVKVEDGGVKRGEQQLCCRTEDGGEFIIHYFDDEITISPSELMGLTEEECHALKCKKDVAYLQTP